METQKHNTEIVGMTTKQKLKELFKIYNISTVFYIDDEINLLDTGIIRIRGELEAIYNSGKEKYLESLNMDGLDISQPKEIVIDYFDSNWDNFDPNLREEIYNKILKINNVKIEKLDLNRAQKVTEQIPVDIYAISPNEWEEKLNTISDLVKDDQKILILVDEDLSHAGEKYIRIKGQDLIAKLRTLDVHDNIICALLTYKIAEAKDELEYRNDLISSRLSADLTVRDFYPLAKTRLDKPEIFADGIKKTLLNGHFEIVKNETVNVMKQSFAKATETINQFDAYDFESTILKTSLDEGVWVPETIFRISNISYEDELKKNMVDVEYAAKVNKELKESRKIAEIKFTIPDNYKPYSDKLKYRHSEIYENGGIINSLRKPIQNGDIFTIDNGYYILLAQPCDLMVRGTKKNFGDRKAQFASLVKMDFIRYSSKSQYTQDLKNNGNETKFILKYFSKNAKDLGIVDFHKYLIIDLNILDLCVFNPKGVCEINVLCPKDNVDTLTSAWEEHYAKVLAKFKKYYDEIKDIKTIFAEIKFKTTEESKKIEMVCKNSYSNLLLSTSDINIPGVEIDNDGILRFPINRTSKVKEPLSNIALEKYTQYLSRNAESHDFAK